VLLLVLLLLRQMAWQPLGWWPLPPLLLRCHL
jgi:hypothetical protein